MFRKISQHQRKYLSHDTIFKLGVSYSSYRLLLSTSLLLILLITNNNNIIIDTKYPDIYFNISLVYFIVCTISFFIFRFIKKFQQTQLLTYILTDIIYLSSILYISTNPNLTTVLLFIIMVLAANMLLPTKQALTITLLSIIVVVYQQVFNNIIDGQNSKFLGTSSIITLVFLATYALGQNAVKRLHYIESLAVQQHNDLIQLQHINQNIVEQLDTGFMVIDNSSMIITLNESARGLLALPIQITSNQNYLTTVLPDLHQLIQENTSIHLRGVFKFKPNQDSEELSIQYRPISSHQKQMTLLIIDSLIRVDQQVQQLKLAALGQLSASIAHEIRNPLAAISQANELLDDSDEEQKYLIQMIARQCQRINHIIDDTLNMSRQNQTIPECIALYSWLKVFITEDLSDIQQYLKLQIEDGIHIYFDVNQLRLILINLIRNAIRHGHELKPESLVVIKAHLMGDFVFLDVIDQGQGVSEQQRANLFEPFYSTATNGTGLGLYLSKTFCEANHARLKYIVQPHGACFRIECMMSHPCGQCDHKDC